MDLHAAAPLDSSMEAGLHEDHNVFLFRRGTASPSTLHLETTSRCNLKCPSCRRTADFPDAAESLSEGVVREFARIAERLDKLTLSGWGESLMGGPVEEILGIAARAGVSTSITTNGTLLTEPVCRMLIENRVSAVTVSIDAGTPEGYERLRPGGVPLERVIEGVNRLVGMVYASGSPVPTVGLAMVYHDGSARELIPLLRLTAERMPRVNLVVLQSLYLYDFSPAACDYRLSDEAVAVLYEARGIAADLGIHLAMELPDVMTRDSGEEAERAVPHLYVPTLEEIRDNALVPTCNSAWQNPFIDSKGGVYPCCIYPEPFGNLNEQSFEEIWHGPKFTEMRLGLHNGNPPEACRNCRKTLWYENRCDPKTPAIADLSIPGYIGLGWNDAEATPYGAGFRWSRGEADVFIRNTREPFIFIEAASPPGGCEVAVSVNGRPLGNLHLTEQWRVHILPAGKHLGDLLRVSFQCKATRRDPDNGEFWWPRRTIGFAAARVGICEIPARVEARNPAGSTPWSAAPAAPPAPAKAPPQANGSNGTHGDSGGNGSNGEANGSGSVGKIFRSFLGAKKS